MSDAVNVRATAHFRILTYSSGLIVFDKIQIVQDKSYTVTTMTQQNIYVKTILVKADIMKKAFNTLLLSL